MEAEIARVLAELSLHRAQQLMAVGDERILARPDTLDDLQPRIVAVAVHAEQPPARTERARQRRHDAACLELTGARAR